MVAYSDMRISKGSLVFAITFMLTLSNCFGQSLSATNTTNSTSTSTSSGTVYLGKPTA